MSLCGCSFLSRVILFKIYLSLPVHRGLPSSHLHWKRRDDGRRGISVACCHSLLCNMSYVSLQGQKRDKPNRVFLPCWWATWSPFPAGMHWVFSPCWCFLVFSIPAHANRVFSRPQWLSWMRRPTEDQEVAGSTPAEVDNILSWRLIVKYFLWSFSPFHWFKKGSCQFLAKECAQYWLTA